MCIAIFEQGYIAPHSAPDASRESLSDTLILTSEAPVQQSADVLVRIASHAADTPPTTVCMPCWLR